MNDQICILVRELLPLYADKACTPESAQIVEQHLCSCPECRHILQEMTMELPVPEVPDKAPSAKPAAVMQKGLRKIRRRWLASLLAILLLIPVGILTFNQFSGQGIAFGNLRELWIANAFLRDMQCGEYEEAFAHIDLEGLKEQWTEWYPAEQLENLDPYALKHFLAAAEGLEGKLQTLRLSSVSYYGYPDSYMLRYAATIDGKKCAVSLVVDDGGVQFITSDYYEADHTASLRPLEEWRANLWREYESLYPHSTS